LTRQAKQPPKPPAKPSKRVRDILHALDRLYPDASCTLEHRDPWQLLVATILSAQCTDQRVNQVTPSLFKRFARVQDMAQAELGEIEELIRSTGFFRNKAKSLKGAAQAITERHGGLVPHTLEELVKLPGVGRKTANVVLGDAFGQPGITVDTHVGRIARRLGLTEHSDAVKAEFDLMAQIPAERWTIFSHQVILHGRQVCKSRRPLCPECTLLPLCPWGRENMS